MKTKIICCPKCGRVRVFGQWKRLQYWQLRELDKRKDEWEKVPVYCADCQATFPKR